jgi:hypothetical protein
MARMTPTPNVMDNDNDYYSAILHPTTKDEAMARMTPARRMDKSSQGPKRAIAVAIARPLGGQPGIFST